MRQFALSTDPVIREAIKLRESLEDTAKEFDIVEQEAVRDGKKAKALCANMDARRIREAMDMLAKLGTEVTRLRLGIEHAADPRAGMSLKELNNMTKSWNCDPVEE